MTPRYEAPQITMLGTVADLTRGLASGSHTDAAFPAHTPQEQLTFS